MLGFWEIAVLAAMVLLVVGGFYLIARFETRER
jgi:hypothetical protein